MGIGGKGQGGEKSGGTKKELSGKWQGRSGKCPVCLLNGRTDGGVHNFSFHVYRKKTLGKDLAYIGGARKR